MADGRHIENRFWLYLGAILADQREIWNRDEGSHADVRSSRDQNCNFLKFKMADGRHFENSFISISQSELSDCDQIWYADANFHSQYGYLTKIEIFQIQDGGRTPY